MKQITKGQSLVKGVKMTKEKAEELQQVKNIFANLIDIIDKATIKDEVTKISAISHLITAQMWTNKALSRKED